MAEYNKDDLFFKDDKELHFSITGPWKNLAFDVEFNFLLQGIIVIDTIEYQCFEFKYETLKAFENQSKMAVWTDSRESDAPTEFHLRYPMTRQFIYGSYFELLLPATNYRVVPLKTGIEALYTTVEITNYSMKLVKNNTDENLAAQEEILTITAVSDIKAKINGVES